MRGEGTGPQPQFDELYSKVGRSWGGGLDCRPSWHRQGRGTPPRVRRGGDSPTPVWIRCAGTPA